MKAIHADPREVRKIFSEAYIIPDFQRPYSWELEQCEKLWEDFQGFFENKQSKEDRYFLGNVVIHEDKQDGYAVIDGQQRLTTLLLLIKAMHNKAATVKALEECLKIKDPLTSEITDTPRLNSLVLSDDKADLQNIIKNNLENIDNASKFKINFNFFMEKIDLWRNQNQGSDKFNELILTLLDQIVLLPIHCGSEDDALTIFETLNNRGMALTDADIFKAKLYKQANDTKDDFINRWNAIEDHEWLFRIYMHIVRAKDSDTSKEIALRTYFTDSTKNTQLSRINPAPNSFKQSS